MSADFADLAVYTPSPGLLERRVVRAYVSRQAEGHAVGFASARAVYSEYRSEPTTEARIVGFLASAMRRTP